MSGKVTTTVIDWEALGVDPKIIVQNSERVRGRFIPTPEIKDEPCAVVAYGPSLRETVDELRTFKGPIFTCSGAHRFLLSRDIVPTFHCESDPRGHKTNMLGHPHLGVTYLIASICHESYFDCLERVNADIRLWHIVFDETEIYNLIPKGDWAICGGNTIGPRALKLARLSGYVNIEAFGFDGSGKHAGEHGNAPPDHLYNEVEIQGRKWSITGNMLYQIKVLFDDLDAIPELKVNFHGDGLIPTLWKSRERRTLPRQVLAVQR